MRAWTASLCTCEIGTPVVAIGPTPTRHYNTAMFVRITWVTRCYFRRTVAALCASGGHGSDSSVTIAPHSCFHKKKKLRRGEMDRGAGTKMKDRSGTVSLTTVKPGTATTMDLFLSTTGDKSTALTGTALERQAQSVRTGYASSGATRES